MKNPLLDRDGGPTLLLELLVGALVVCALTVCFAPHARSDDSRPSVLTDQPKVVIQSPAPKVDAAALDPELGALRDDVQILCGGSNARVQMDGTGASLPAYPCAVAQTNLALYRLQDKEGFVPSVQRSFLKAASFTRGIGATILGVLGLS